MGDKKEWLKAEIDELINMYHGKPELWDVKCKVYKDRVKKHNALTEIAGELNTTIEEIQRKIHNLRNQFNSEFKKITKTKSGQGTNELYVSKWPYYKSLLFLQGGFVCKSTIGNLPTVSKKIHEIFFFLYLSLIIYMNLYCQGTSPWLLIKYSRNSSRTSLALFE